MKLRDLMGPLAVGTLAIATLSACSGGADEPKAEDSTAATPAAPAATAPAAAPAAAVDFASLTGDATKGQKVFMQCMACHSIKEGENRVGPSLHGIIGRAAGSVAGFNYSAANKGSGLTWSKDQLFTYLEAPQKTIPGTKMAFVGLPTPQDRADVIAYLDAND
jgi:cytochrome c